MKIQHLIINETAAHDRAILSLSVKISSYILDKYGDKTGRPPIDMGTVGDLFDTPLTGMNHVELSIQNSNDIEQTYKDHHPAPENIEEDDGVYYGLWIPTTNTIVINSDYVGTNKFRTVVSHELRHALDDYISDYRAGKSSRYDTPRNPAHRKRDPYYPETPYLAKPSEINARYLEALHRLNPKIHRAVKRNDPDLFNTVIDDFKQALKSEEISDLFPRGVADPSYRRLFMRGIDYIKNEIEYAKQKHLPDKRATMESIMNEIDYSAGVEQISPELINHIITNSKEVGDFENRIVNHINVNDYNIYSYISSDKIDALVFLQGNNLRGIQNFSKIPGAVTALIAFITQRLQKKVIIDASEPLTPAGFRWLYQLLAAEGRGLTIRDQTGNFPDKENLKAEWVKLMKSEGHGTTRIVIEYNMRRHFRSIEEYNKLIFKHTFFIGDERLL